MSRRKRGRITVQYQPTGAARGVRRVAGLVQAIFGFVFVVVALTAIMPVMPLFSLPFLAMGGLAIVVGLMDEAAGEEPSSPAPEDYDHIPSPELSAKERLEQLNTLKEAGLITREEYDQKRQEILSRL